MSTCRHKEMRRVMNRGDDSEFHFQNRIIGDIAEGNCSFLANFQRTLKLNVLEFQTHGVRKSEGQLNFQK